MFPKTPKNKNPLFNLVPLKKGTNIHYKKERTKKEKIFFEEMECQKIYLEGMSEDARDELLFLYNLGVEIEELEYLIRVKLRESLNW